MSVAEGPTGDEARHIAEFNFGRLRHGWEDPRSADFVAGLDAVNAVAMRSPGFVWMLDGDAMDAVQRDPSGVFGGDPAIAATLSVWRSVAALRAFVHNTLHKRFFARGPEWFEPPAGPNFVMWPVPAGHRPSAAEAMARIDQLRDQGPGPSAFSWDWAAAHLA